MTDWETQLLKIPQMLYLPLWKKTGTPNDILGFLPHNKPSMPRTKCLVSLNESVALNLINLYIYVCITISYLNLYIKFKALMAFPLSKYYYKGHVYSAPAPDSQE